jgi:hypothetical protein
MAGHDVHLTAMDADVISEKHPPAILVEILRREMLAELADLGTRHPHSEQAQ